MRGFSSLVEVLDHHARHKSDAPAVTLESGRPADCATLSFGDLYSQAATLAAELQTEASPDERVLLIFPTCLEFVVGYFACLMAGLVAVPLMPPRRNANHDASAAIIADCQPRLALCLQRDAEPGAALQLRLDAAGVKQLAVALSPEPGAWRAFERCRSDLAFLQYTSGSTSAPKGVMVSHGNLLDNLEMIRTRLGNHAGSTHVSWIPLYHDLGLIMNLLQPLYLGAQSVLMLPSGFMFRPLSWLRAIHAHRAEVAAAPNFAYDLCVDRFRPDQMDGIDLSGWKIAVNGAEPVRAATLARFAETFALYGFDARAMHPTYGLAEATLVVSSASRGSPVRLREVSANGLLCGSVRASRAADDIRTLVGCGSGVPGLSLAIVDPVSRRRMSGDKIGEIWVQADSVAGGYWQRPDESQATFKARIEPAADEAAGKSNRLRTGDLGHLDADGELYVVGRMKDVLIIRGVNHYPQDIEATVADSHPALRRDHGAVFGVVDAQGIEQVVLVQEVERTQRDKFSRPEAMAAVRAAVVNNHELSFHDIVLIRPGTIPKTTSGKIQRSLTRQRWLDRELELWNEPASVAGKCQTSG